MGSSIKGIGPACQRDLFVGTTAMDIFIRFLYNLHPSGGGNRRGTIHLMEGGGGEKTIG